MANAHWSNHSYLNRESTARGLALAIKGKGYQIDAFSPFVFGGFGFYYPSATRLVGSELLETRSQLVFGVNAGGGVELRLNSKVVIGAIFHYHDPFDVRQEVGPTLQASYLKLLFTVLYTFN
jgi:opacity protein-like surface antigen